MRFLPKDFTKQENFIAEELSNMGLRYDQQVPMGKFTLDFWVPEIGLVIEADGIYGHYRKRDTQRDGDIMRMWGVQNILHIKDSTKEGIQETLWLALDNLQQEKLKVQRTDL